MSRSAGMYDTARTSKPPSTNNNAKHSSRISTTYHIPPSADTSLFQWSHIPPQSSAHPVQSPVDASLLPQYRVDTSSIPVCRLRGTQWDKRRAQ